MDINTEDEAMTIRSYDKAPRPTQLKRQSKEIDRLRAENVELRKMLKQFMVWLEDGTLVRDISHDSEPSWAIRLIKFTSALNNAAAVLSKPKGE